MFFFVYEGLVCLVLSCVWLAVIITTDVKITVAAAMFWMVSCSFASAQPRNSATMGLTYA